MVLTSARNQRSYGRRTYALPDVPHEVHKARGGVAFLLRQAHIPNSCERYKQKSALRKNLTGPAILAGLVFGVNGTRRRRGWGNVGIPRPLRDFQARWGRWKSGVGLFHGFHGASFPQPSSGFWAILARMPSLGTTGGSIPHFSEPATDAHFSRFLRRAQKSDRQVAHNTNPHSGPKTDK